MSLSRRRLLQAAGAASALAAVPAQAQKKGKAVTDASGPLPIVDTHQHLWDLARFRLPWLSGAAGINRSFTPRDYAEATRGLNVVKSVYMEVDVAPEQQVAEAEYVLELCRRDDNPTVAAVISGRPGEAGFREYFARFKDAKEIKGVRQVLHGATPRGYCLEPTFIRSLRYLGEHGKRFDLCMRSPELADAAKLVGECPDTRFILDHCGNPNPQEPDPARRSQWETDLKRLAERPNVVCKVSGIIASVKPGWKAADLAPVINTVLSTFGPERVMFGGDWPVCTLGASYAEWVAALKEIVKERPLSEQRKLFSENAVRFYGLGS